MELPRHLHLAKTSLDLASLNILIDANVEEYTAVWKSTSIDEGSVRDEMYHKVSTLTDFKKWLNTPSKVK